MLVYKFYDSNDLRKKITALKAEVVIPSKRNRRVFISHDIDIYKHRNWIERCFNRLKHFRRFATRYDRCTGHFQDFVHLGAAMMNVDPTEGATGAKQPPGQAQRALKRCLLVPADAGMRRFA